MSEFSTSGSIGAFCFGEDNPNISSTTSGSSIELFVPTVSGTAQGFINPEDSYIDIVIPTKIQYAVVNKEFLVDFIGKPSTDDECVPMSCYDIHNYEDYDVQITGGNPISVDFVACAETSGVSDYTPTSYTWWFDYANYSTSADAVVTDSNCITHKYCGGYLEEYDVRLCVTFASVNDTKEICKKRDALVKTYGADELRYGKDRYIDLDGYVPNYIQPSDTTQLLEKFEYYLNHMFPDQRNYTWEENDLEVTMCQTKDCNRGTTCNDIEGCVSGTCYLSGDCGNPITSAVNDKNSYEFTGLTSDTSGDVEILAKTPATSVGEVFINDVCEIKDDKISILDKIFRLTELFDADLIPIELIQFYAENLGYTAGISRDAVGATGPDDKANEIEQKRYLRFMMRNLPNWYQIKTTRSSIRIMLYSFGLIGDFVYYYSKCYTDIYNPEDKGLCGIIDESTTGCEDGESSDVTQNSERCNTVCEDKGPNINLITGHGIVGSCLEDAEPETTAGDCNDCNIDMTSRNLTPEQLAINNNCKKQYLSNLDRYEQEINKSYNLNTGDWLLTNVDTTSLSEDLSTIHENDGYFSTPHFKLYVDINDSIEGFSLNSEKQRMVKEAVNAMKPINTVYDGVNVAFNPGYATMYMRAMHRVRKHLAVLSDRTLVGSNYKVMVEYQNEPPYKVPLDGTTIVTATDVTSILNPSTVVTITVGEGMTTIGPLAFKEKFGVTGGSPLTDIYLPSTLTYVDTEGLHNIARGSSDTDPLLNGPNWYPGSIVNFASGNYVCRWFGNATGATYTIPLGDNTNGLASWAQWQKFSGRFILSGYKPTLGPSTFGGTAQDTGGFFEVEFTHEDIPASINGDWLGSTIYTAYVKIFCPTTAHTNLEWKTAIAIGQAGINITHINNIPIGLIV